MSALLQHGITVQAQRRPNAVALVHNGERWSYGTLETLSTRLAHLLVEVGCRRGDRVALLMAKQAAAIIGMLGVLKADAAYVPLDPAGPAPRLARMLRVSDCRCILAAGNVTAMLQDALQAAALDRPPLIGWLDRNAAGGELAPEFEFTWRDLEASPDSAPACTNTDRDIAHILFTSGSTGTPKGVMITHSSVVHFLRWANKHFGTAPGERISQHSPLHFDLSTFDIFGTLWAGAELHLVPPELNLLPHKLARFISEARLTQWFSVPSVLNLMAKYDLVEPDRFADLKRVLWCGEAIPTPTLMHWMRRLPRAQFTNLYGPTEATIASSFYTVPRCPRDEREAIPIGTPCEGETLLVLDEDLRPVAPGEAGDLYIGGVGLSPGYWRDPEKTHGAFLPHPDGLRDAARIYRTGDLARIGENGLVYFLGRADAQIKSRGYRIELGEIEAAAHATGLVRECAVVAVATEGFEGNVICCAYSCAPGERVGAARLREKLGALLPGYMLPAQWLAFESLPKNANGKVDRPALRSAFLHREECIDA